MQDFSFGSWKLRSPAAAHTVQPAMNLRVLVKMRALYFKMWLETLVGLLRFYYYHYLNAILRPFSDYYHV